MYTLHNNSKANNHALHVDHTKFTLYIGSTNFLKNKANKWLYFSVIFWTFYFVFQGLSLEEIEDLYSSRKKEALFEWFCDLLPRI